MTDAPPSDPACETDDPDAYCAAIAARNGSPLWLVGRSLPPVKRRFFAATYASMRLIDDFVDTAFLPLPPAERAALRPAALERLDEWRAGVEAAARGMCTKMQGPEAPVFRALAAVLPRTDLGVAPWQALLRALRRDIEERPIDDWDGFLDYCEGATVAPAMVFIYILGSREEAGTFRWTLPEPPSFYASDITVFCYLVHILRDLVEDSKGDSQLLTIPRSALSDLSLSPARLQDAIRKGETAKVERLIRILADEAQRYRDGADRRLDQLGTLIDPTELCLLMALYRAYTALHDRILAQPDAVLQDPDGLRGLQRATLSQAMALTDGHT